jgi:hypothetical protein
MKIGALLERNSLDVYRNDKCFGQNFTEKLNPCFILSAICPQVLLFSI